MEPTLSRRFGDCRPNKSNQRFKKLKGILINRSSQKQKKLVVSIPDISAPIATQGLNFLEVYLNRKWRPTP